MTSKQKPRRLLDDTTLARKDLIDMVRTRTRLNHRIAMRHELNEIEAAILDEFDARVVRGAPYEMSFEDIDRVLEDGGSK